MSLIDFYKNVLTSLGLEEKDGYIYLKTSEGDSMPWVNDGKQIVLPTRKHLSKLLEEDEDGKIQVVRIPYNPLNEDVVKGDSISLEKTKLAVERMIGHNIGIVGELLLTLASDKVYQKNTKGEINNFLAAIVEAKGPNMKQIVDEKTIKKWIEIYEATLKAPKGVISIYLKKGGIKDGDRFNRLAVTDSPLYEELIKAVESDDKEKYVYGVKLDRNKDSKILKALVEFILPDLNNNNCLEIGSNDNESPAFISLYRTYLKFTHRTNKLLGYLKGVSADVESLMTELPITEDDLTSLSIYKKELVLIPNETDINRAKLMPQSRIQGLNNDMLNRTVGSSNLSNSNVRSSLNRSVRYPNEAVDYDASLDTSDPVDRIFSKLNTTVTPISNRMINNGFNQGLGLGNMGGFNNGGMFGNGLGNYQQPNIGLGSFGNNGFNNGGLFNRGLSNTFANNIGFRI